MRVSVFSISRGSPKRSRWSSETHGLPGKLLRLLAVAGLFMSVDAARAQSGFYLRLAPEVGRIAVEHTKKVTIQGGSSSSTSSSSGLALAGTLSGGARLKLPGNWLVGGELVGVVSSRRKLNGMISPTTSGNIHDVWPGRWDFSDLSELGGNFLFGRALGAGRSQVYLFSGMNRAWTEFASGGTNPDTGVAGEDRERLARWPWTIGAGTTLRLKWPLDFRVRYARSLTDWIVDTEGARLDYRYKASGVFFSVGVQFFD